MSPCWEGLRCTQVTWSTGHKCRSLRPAPGLQNQNLRGDSEMKEEQPVGQESPARECQEEALRNAAVATRRRAGWWPDLGLLGGRALGSCSKVTSAARTGPQALVVLVAREGDARQPGRASIQWVFRTKHDHWSGVHCRVAANSQQR